MHARIRRPTGHGPFSQITAFLMTGHPASCGMHLIVEVDVGLRIALLRFILAILIFPIPFSI
jgi:hypothetical protein